MRALAVVLALLVAVPALAQVGGDGGGIKPRQSQKLTLIPGDQYITTTYNFTSVPGAALSGLMLQQSTAAGVTVSCAPPFLELTAASANRRALIWERGPTQDGLGVPMGVTDEVTIQLHITGLDTYGANANAFFEFMYGDTNNYLVTKIPSANDSFGFIVAGSGKSAAASVPTDKITCFTVAYGGGGADTNYVSTRAPTSTEKITIHANPGGGNVDFWFNDVLIASVPSGRQGGDPSNFAWAAWVNGDASATVFAIGPVTVQRIWP